MQTLCDTQTTESACLCSQAAMGSDPRAANFVAALLSWTDYTAFCELMCAVGVNECMHD